MIDVQFPSPRDQNAIENPDRFETLPQLHQIHQPLLGTTMS